MWTNPLINFGDNNPFGKTNDEIQKTWRRLFHEKGIKILVSAFGATENPTSGGHDPVTCATKLGNFILNNNLDGVDLDWEDNEAMNRGLGEAWLIAFTKKLRQMIPDHVLTHAPQAPYFCKENYKNGAYITVHEQVGHLIDFYNVQFYNQVDTTYDTYERLFVKSVGFFNKTSVKEINERGIPLEMLVVGKPATPADASNTGYMNQTALGHAVTRAVQESTWRAGVMFWQFYSDSNGTILDAVIKGLKSTEEEVI